MSFQVCVGVARPEMTPRSNSQLTQLAEREWERTWLLAYKRGDAEGKVALHPWSSQARRSFPCAEVTPGGRRRRKSE